MSLAFSLPAPLLRLRPRPCVSRHSLVCTASPVAAAGLVLPPSPIPSRFDSGAISGAAVQRYLSDEGARFVMWYAGRPLTWASSAKAPPGTSHGFVGLALSSDGITWDRVEGPLEAHSVLAPNDDWWTFDTVHLSLGSVSIDSNDMVRADAGVYFMYYGGGNAEKVTVGGAELAGARMAIGVAISKDGEHFTRIEGEHPSGAVLERGDEGAFDELFVAGPCVVRAKTGASNAGKYVMHYFSFDERRGRFAIGQAISKDGLRFERARNEPVITGEGCAFAERGVSRCCVVERAAGRFVIFVECVDGEGVHRIAMAESSDCQTWGDLKVVLEPGEAEAWDCKGVSHPSVVQMDDDQMRMYYRGRGSEYDAEKGTGSGIGVAASNGADWTRLERILTEQQ